MKNVDAGTTFRLNPYVVGQALTLANLDWTDLKRGSHPDDGEDCLYLEADVREYSAFLVTLAVQYRHVDGLLPLADRVHNPGLEPERADVIVGGMNVLVMVFRRLGFPAMVVSESDILDGLVASLALGVAVGSR